MTITANDERGSDIRNEIIDTLRNIANRLEDNNLDDKTNSLIYEYFLKYKFMNENENIKRDDALKFMSLGWYIYSNMSN